MPQFASRFFHFDVASNQMNLLQRSTFWAVSLLFTCWVSAGEFEPDLPVPDGELNLLPGFKSERLYSVPSLVSMTLDHQGRIIGSDVADQAWPHLPSGDWAICYAARVAIEHQDVTTRQRRSFDKTNRQVFFEVMLALARQGDVELCPQIVRALTRWDWEVLTAEQRLLLLQIYDVVLNRMGLPDVTEAASVIEQIRPYIPNHDGAANCELSKLLFELQSKLDDLIDRTLEFFVQTPTAMAQIHFALLWGRLDQLLWTEQQKRRLREVLDLYEVLATEIRHYKDIQKLVKNLRENIGITDADPSPLAARGVVKQSTVKNLLLLATTDAIKHRDLAKGRAAYRLAQYHTFRRLGGSEGTLGPSFSLNDLAGRFTSRDLLESIIEPSKMISDQYRLTLFVMNDGREICGQIVDLARRIYRVRTNPLLPFERMAIKHFEIEETIPSNVSLMPHGLLDSLQHDELIDWIAYGLDTSFTNHPATRDDRAVNLIGCGIRNALSVFYLLYFS